jgi:hypothetical protein
MTGDCRYCEQGYPVASGVHSGAPTRWRLRHPTGKKVIGPTPCENLDLLEPAAVHVRAWLHATPDVPASLRKAVETLLTVAEENERELERLKAGIRQVHHDVDEGLLRLIEEWPSA